MPKQLQMTDRKIRMALGQAHGIRSHAAHILGISPRTLARRIASNPSLAVSQADIEAKHQFDALKTVYDAAIGGDVYAQIQWLKWRGWGREVRSPEPIDFEYILVTADPDAAVVTPPAGIGEPVDELAQSRKSRP